jgi:DNA-binding transcriptional MerR regulator
LKQIGTYSIKDLEQLSGIKAHTIRIWEVRYGLLKPSRTDTNIRYYDDEQLKRLLNISFLIKNGLKVSKISSMDSKELHDNLASFYDGQENDQSTDDKINNLVVAMIELNEDLFETVFSSAVHHLGFENAVTKVVYPFLDKVGMLWTMGNIQPAQEHFISNLIRQKIIVAIDKQSISKKPISKFLLFLPEGEMHEIGLLLANYMIRKKGNQTIYLGQNVPLEDVLQVCDSYAPDYIFTYITTPRIEDDLKSFFDKLANSVKKGKVLVSGHIPEVTFKLPARVKRITSIKDLKSLLN